MKSEFEKWFKEQYGKEPYPEKSIYNLEKIVEDTKKLLQWNEKKRSEKERWLDKRDAALKAWCAGKYSMNEIESSITHCPHCHCMTKTIKGKCGKCRKEKK